jgi:hypothetical protein
MGHSPTPMDLVSGSCLLLKPYRTSETVAALRAPKDQAGGSGITFPG